MEGGLSKEPQTDVFEIEQRAISCKLNIVAEQQIVDGVFINFILLNQSNKDLSVLTWHTPLEGFYSNLFIIQDQQGQIMPYQGPIAKRDKPSTVDYQLIRARGNVATMLDLSSVYALIPGNYTLQLNKKTLQVIENDMPMSICQCQTECLTFSVC